ncbi:MAG: hybrid sensor histidine kinase/response regulator [Calditrichaeota bacterium]|nr:MAG: hybrid sensor histidine kinase/response regulator [Calditrichota bacterium]
MENPKLKILVVSPKENELLQLKTLFQNCNEFGLEIFCVQSYDETTLLRKSEKFVIAFVSSLFQIQEFAKALKIPIIALVKSSQNGKKMLSNGATDYLVTSDLNPEDLERILRYTNSLFISQQKLIKRKSHFEVLFENSPNSLWEQDFSQLKIYLDSLVEQGLVDIKKYFKQNPAKLTSCLNLIKIISINEETVKLYNGRNKEEILNNFSEFFTNESLKTFLEEIVTLHNGEATFETETLNKDLKGRLLHIRLKIFIPEVFRNDWSRVFVSVTDITNSIKVKKELLVKSDKLNLTNAILEREIQDRKTIQESLQKSEERYRLLAENINDLICLHKPNGEFVYVSHSCKEILGFRPEELVGKNPYDFFHEDDKERIQKESHEQILKGENHSLIVYRFRKKDKSHIWFETYSQPILDQNSQVINIVTSSRDVTERVNYESKLSEYASALKKSNDDLERFAYSASHDLQEPLRTISGFLGILERKHKNNFDSDSLQFIDLCLQNSNRMQEMIESLLQYSRVRTGEKELKNINLNSILDAIIFQHLQSTIEQRKAKITYSQMPTILANKYEIFALFQNLISNSIKFVSNEKTPIIKISVEEKTNEWLFAIEDNGIGIQPEKSELVFTIFKRLHTRTEFKGSGIGLATCKKIVESYNGRIWYKPKSNDGTTFFFTIPFFN